MTTPNMGLVPPVVSTTPGPTWASLLNTAFDTVDTHDHSPGHGVLIPTAGLNINGNLSLNSHDLKDIRGLRLDNQVASLTNSTDIRILYSKGGELAYRDALGNEVILTASGSVAGATGSITGLTAPAAASYSSITKTFSWVYDSSKAAKFSMADVAHYPYDGSTVYSFAVTLKSPTALSASYSWSFPAAAASQGAIVSVSTAGQLAYGAADGTVGAPSIPFTSDLDTGLYRIGSGETGYAANGTKTFSLGSYGVRCADGSAAAPSLAFATDTDSGLYSYDDGVVGFSSNGTLAARYGTSQFLFADGSNTAPGLSFMASPGLGLYRRAANQIVVAAAGADCLYVDPTGIAAVGHIYGDSSKTADGPAFTFGGDDDTGFWNSGPNLLGVSVGGTNVAGFSSGGIDSGGGGAIKWEVFSGTRPAHDPGLALTVSGTVIGAAGISSVSGSGTSRIDIGHYQGSGNYLTFDNGWTGTDRVVISQVASTTANTYNVVVYYQ